MKKAPALDYDYQWKRLIEAAAEHGATQNFWRECDEIDCSSGVGLHEIDLLKHLMLRHGLWF